MEKKIGAEKQKEEKTKPTDEFLGLVLSWSFSDIMNNNLFKNKVQKIPDKFSCTDDYMNSFKQPLIEEARASLCSGLEALGQAPACEITHLLRCKPKPGELFRYKIRTKKITSHEIPIEVYEPESGDLVFLTNVRPERIHDLNLSENHNQFVIASVLKLNNSSFFDIQLSLVKEIGLELRPHESNRVYATYLQNMTTNIRIWRALNPYPKTANLRLVQEVLQYDPSGDDDCHLCISEQNSTVLDLIDSFKLDESQKNAVLSCVSAQKCLHRGSNVKLIWGPPGTGKTKTVASMLFALLKLGCRTLTCAPTNIAVLQVAERLMSLVLASLDHDTYGLGDILLFGNEERMKVNDHDMLVDIFLDNREQILTKCMGNWRSSLGSMIAFLEDPQGKYDEYIKKCQGKKKKKKVQQSNVFNKSLKYIEKGGKYQRKKIGENEEANVEKEDNDLMRFEEFFRGRIYPLLDLVMFCAKNFYTHLPTKYIPLAVAQQMIGLNHMLKSLESGRNKAGNLRKWTLKKAEILAILKSLHEQFPGPKIKSTVRDFCMSKSCLVFCTASSSIKVCGNVQMVILDEAAQLKECESAIPLQVSGASNAILIGDDKQLPAMVQSKVSENAVFGRSLFQRLATLGKKKQLLNIQYRMHPSISLFPSKKFYEKNIVDGPNVKEKSYEKCFLKGQMYGSYSFIDVNRGKEDFTRGHSPRNFEEAMTVIDIISKLFKEYHTRKQKMSVGVISPYKGQVSLIKEELGKKYDEHKEGGFSVSVRSVDGFQGGEEDIIIISTVRSNRNGSVGFLSNHQRTNVALTRARYCLWIVGNGTTLVKSGSVWKDLVINAMTRGCFRNVEQDGHFDSTLGFDLLKHGKTRWKVFFSDDFKFSMATLKGTKTKNKVEEMVKKLAHGWRDSTSKKVVDSEFLEQYKVNDGQLYLAWSIDIVKEDSKYTQVIKVWDISPAFQLPKLVNELDILFGSYTLGVLNRCKHKALDGKLVVPMSWSLQSVWVPVLKLIIIQTVWLGN